MIQNYEIKKIDNEEVLFLYFDFDVEFAKLNKEDKKSKITDIVDSFLKKNKIKFDGKKIVVFTGGLLALTLVMNKPVSQVNSYTLHYDYPMISDVVKQEEVNEEIIIETSSEVLDEPPVKVNQSESITSVSQNKPSSITSNTNKTSSSSNKTTSNSSNISSNSNSSQTIETNTNETTIEAPQEDKTFVTIKRSSGVFETIELEEYIVGVVAAEMPASFPLEALKAQAVIARTYTLKAIESGKVLTDDSTTQNYIEIESVKSSWGSSYNTYYNKIKNAVESTKGVYLTYNGVIIDAVYHSTSNGKTENAEYVWGNKVPYLVSVSSEYDNLNKTFLESTFLSYETISQKLGFDVTVDTSWEILSKTVGERVNEISIGGNVLTGVKVRSLLGLKSADFEIEKTEAGITFTTKGWGHGVGLSQYGAYGMAKNGKTYQEILKHYYTGVTLNYS